MTKSDVANLKVRLGDHLIKTAGETEVFESKAARVVRHKEFTQQTLVRLVVSLPSVSVDCECCSTRTWPSSVSSPRSPPTCPT